MRLLILLVATVLSPLLMPSVFGCTFFKVTKGGMTMVGNNEDAWSIDPRIWFENGKPGEYGTVYLGQNNSTPQGGMNEAGLMFDGLRSPPKSFAGTHGKPPIHFDDLARRVLRSCANVHQAAAVIRTFDFSQLNGAYLIFVDRSGEYLVVEADTLFTGTDATYAVTNFCISTCKDFDSVPSERYQRGRALLADGGDTSLAFCTSMVKGMHACRKKLGEGTLYSNIFDPQRGLVHLYFYHDYTTLRSFNLKDELAKGDHSLDMIALFPPNAEFAKLVAYRTPFHSPALWGFLLFAALVALLFGVYAAISLVVAAIARLRGRQNGSPVLPMLVGGACSLIVLFLVPTLLLNQGVFYFGLADTLDHVLPVLRYLPLLLCALTIPLVLWTYRDWRARILSSIRRWSLTIQTLTVMAVLVGLFYWNMILG